MKQLLKLLCLYGALSATVQGARANTILTFDDLSVPVLLDSADYTTIPNGYGGLQWDNFGVLDTTTLEQKASGHHTGLSVSVGEDSNTGLLMLVSLAVLIALNMLRKRLASAKPGVIKASPVIPVAEPNPIPHSIIT